MAQAEKSLFDLTEEKLSLGRRVQSALDPLEEIETKRALQLLDTFADRRLGHVQNIGRARRGSVGHDYPEDLNLPKIHGPPNQ
ncbi:hypothetical protein MesoLj113c_28590 [Mesorhizobium sp. 113-3-9]|nr:hypothetical protein MesoLj113c_28590 [Mesorhizobium sp. 113-3-9]